MKSKENMKDKKDIKLKIFETAFGMYFENPTQFSVRNVAKELKLSREQVYTHFTSKKAILRYFYQLCFEEYINQTNEIDRYSEFTLEEKLAHLVYTHIELFQKEKEFVESTFNEIIFKANANNIFQKSLEKQVEKILDTSEGDASILPSKYLAMILVKELFHIFKYWIKDDSEKSEDTIELIDKIIAFLGEILSNQIITKGIDLGRTLWGQNHTRLAPNDLKFLFNSFFNRFA